MSFKYLFMNLIVSTIVARDSYSATVFDDDRYIVYYYDSETDLLLKTEYYEEFNIKVMSDDCCVKDIITCFTNNKLIEFNNISPQKKFAMERKVDNFIEKYFVQ